VSDSHSRILSEFIDEWNAGRRPSVDAFLDRASPGERSELAGELSAYIAIGPAPRYDAAALEALRADPIVAAADAGLWSVLVPSLRERLRLSTSDVAASLVGKLGFAPAREDKTRDYLERLERGAIPPQRVSRRLLDALAAILRVSPAELDVAGRLGGASPGMAVAFRADRDAAEAARDDRELFAAAAAAPASADWDEVDEAFLGGR
jgi:hypothetical protein